MDQPVEAPASRTCFIAMPVTTSEGDAIRFGDADHWTHVLDHLFVPAVERAGYEAIRPVTKGSHMIHAEIIRSLEQADLVLCDLSSLNPNVLFELGIRTAVDRPAALVRDEQTELPFDTSGMNTARYSSALNAWDLTEEIARLSQHITESAESCGKSNPLWRQFGLTIRASEPDTGGTQSDARLTLIANELQDLRRMMNEGSAISHAANQPPLTAADLRRALTTPLDPSEIGADPIVKGTGIRAAMAVSQMLILSNQVGRSLKVVEASSKRLRVNVGEDWTKDEVDQLFRIAASNRVLLEVSRGSDIPD